MSLTKKHFKLIANSLRVSDTREALIYNLCRVFEEENPNFDEVKFKEACLK